MASDQILIRTVLLATSICGGWRYWLAWDRCRHFSFPLVIPPSLRLPLSTWCCCTETRGELTNGFNLQPRYAIYYHDTRFIHLYVGQHKLSNDRRIEAHLFLARLSSYRQLRQVTFDCASPATETTSAAALVDNLDSDTDAPLLTKSHWRIGTAD